MLTEHSDKGGCPSLHLTPHPPFPPCWGTHSAKQPGPSTGLPVTEAEPWPQAPTPARDFWIPEFPRLPQVPSDAPLLSCSLWVPSCSAYPYSASGTPVPIHSPDNLRALQIHCGLTSSRAPKAMAPHIHFLPQNTPIVLQRAAGAAGPGATKNPHLILYFWFFPFFFPVFLVFQVCATAIPQQTNLPAPATGGGSGPWAPLGAGG